MKILLELPAAMLIALALFASPGQGNPQAIFTRARQAQEKRDWKEAERLYRECLQWAPNLGQAHANLGVVYAEEGKLQAAVGEYRRALKVNPALSSVYLDLGIGYFREADYENAIPPLRRFISLQPGNHQARELLGLSYVEIDRFSDAIQLLAPLRATHDPAVLLALGASYIRLRQMTQAQDVIRTLLVAQPNSPRVHFLLGQTFAGLDAFPQALREFKAVYSLDPQWPQIQLLLGAVEAKLGDLRRAESYLRSQLISTPGNFQTNYTLGAVLNHERRFHQAIPFLIRATGRRPHSGDALYELARAYWKVGQNAKAWKTVQLAVSADAGNGQAHYLCGEIARARGDEKRAQREYSLAESLSESKSKHDILRLTELTQH